MPVVATATADQDDPLVTRPIVHAIVPASAAPKMERAPGPTSAFDTAWLSQPGKPLQPIAPAAASPQRADFKTARVYTDEKILALIAAEGEQTVQSVSRHFRTGGTGAHHHLKRLVEQGKLQVRSGGGKYGLSNIYSLPPPPAAASAPPAPVPATSPTLSCALFNTGDLLIETPDDGRVRLTRQQAQQLVAYLDQIAGALAGEAP